MNAKKSILAAAVAAAVFAGPGILAQGTSYLFNTPVAGITGHVSVHVFYGPPGFGDNPDKDLKESHYLLFLDTPVSLRPGKGDTLNRARPRVRLVYLTGKTGDITRFSEKKVKVSGKFLISTNETRLSDVTLELSNISLAGDR